MDHNKRRDNSKAADAAYDEMMRTIPELAEANVPESMRRILHNTGFLAGINHGLKLADGLIREEQRS